MIPRIDTRRLTFRLFLICCLGVSGWESFTPLPCSKSLAEEPYDTRTQIPSAERQQEVRKLLEETQELSRATTPKQKQAIVKKLMEDAADPTTTADERYVMLSLVLPWTVELSDFATLKAALQQLTDNYKVDAVSERSTWWQALLTARKPGGSIEDALKECAAVAALAGSQNRYQDAEELLAATEKQAARITSKKEFHQLTEARAAVKERQQAYEEQQKAATTLAKTPGT